jgi:Family of unknown function (DUF5670)
MGLLELLIVLLIVLWATGAGLAIGGSFVHLLLVIVVILIAVKILRGERV